MIDKELPRATLEQAMEGTDLFVVDITIGADNHIVVDIDSDSSVDIDECDSLTRAVEARCDRDTEDYDLEIGSAGITAPLQMPRQYAKYIGKNVEVLTADGRKLKGELRAADDEGFSIAGLKKEKPEGAKRPIMVAHELTFKYSEIKYTKYLIEF